MKLLEERESYKHLGVVEANEKKNKVKKECYRRVTKVLETMLKTGNVFNTCFNSY